MAWDRIEFDDDAMTQDFKLIASNQDMSNSVKSLFGDHFTYKNESFENIDSQIFDCYNLNQGIIEYSNDSYIAQCLEGGGGSAPYISEVAQKAVRCDDEIKIYVKTAFVDTDYNEEKDSFYNYFYSDFDFKNEEFTNQIKVIDENDFYKDNYEYSYTGIKLQDNPEFDKIKDELNTYVYTFKTSGDDYYLVSFEKVDEKDVSMSSEFKEMAQKEKSLGKYLSAYALRDCIESQLYTLDLVVDKTQISPTKEKIMIEGQIYELYKTNIKYEEFKKALLNYISEELFEQQFTMYQKDIDGILYIVYNAGDRKNYDIEEITKISDNIYEVEYKYYVGESEEVPGKFIVELENNNGSWIVKNCKSKILEDVKYFEVTIPDEDAKEEGIYEDFIKIDDFEKINELQNMINTAVEHEFYGAFGLYSLPYSIFHMSNGEEITISAMGNFEMEGEECGNYIIVMTNDDKKVYKVNENIEKYFVNLYKK